MNEFDMPFPKESKQDKKKIEAAKLLSKSLIYAFAIFGLIFVIILFFFLCMLRSQGEVIASVPNSAILAVDFDEKFSETKDNDIMAELSGVQNQNFFDMIKTLNVAAYDNRVKALVGKINISSLGLAQIQELRQTVLSFKKSGKKAYLYAPSFGSFGQGTKEYYLASVFDEIVIAPNSEVGITGIGIEVPFFREVLDKIGVQPEFYSRYEYKTAMDSMTQKEMSAPFKAEMKKLGEGIFNRMVADIAAVRKLSEKDVVTLINQAPLSSDEALKAKLVDKISFKQDYFDNLEKAYQAKLIDLADYQTNIQDHKKGTTSIALLVIDGVIAEGESSAESLQEEVVTGADTVLSQLKEIDEDKNVKALVVRVNSPGGGYNAANDIWHGIEQLKAKKKIPVIVSMGDYAASGGYFVAIAGDKIVAEPSTITGSIGVLGGKMVLQNLWKKLGVHWQRIAFGQNAGILSANAPFSEQEKSIFNKSLDNVYSDFTSKVAKARNISEKEMNKLARGRVWLGEQALKVKLVDELGGIETALSLAQKAAQIKDDEKVRIEFYPKEKTLQEKLQQLIGGGKGLVMSQQIKNFSEEIKTLRILNRLKYNAILPPMQIEM